ncbi:hypothetical protein GMOD_00009986 [Pyrenophora seminiperda CCB06]|uniref:Uncharacterized protein n=1 Tax=Pyrenophora seminiperda CCB06 TaxID=1302712 RepID=A0A3M7M1G6_9PLEO|nr:hypothetical protein GMOD_00009986 [Pyrenophora seminiperda CCB06]
MSVFYAEQDDNERLSSPEYFPVDNNAPPSPARAQAQPQAQVQARASKSASPAPPPEPAKDSLPTRASSSSLSSISASELIVEDDRPIAADAQDHRIKVKAEEQTSSDDVEEVDSKGVSIKGRTEVSFKEEPWVTPSESEEESSLAAIHHRRTQRACRSHSSSLPPNRRHSARTTTKPSSYYMPPLPKPLSKKKPTPDRSYKATNPYAKYKNTRKPSSSPPHLPPKPLLANDIRNKKLIIDEITSYWGQNFIKTYIPKPHRPLVKRGMHGKRAAYRCYENDPINWKPSILKAILMISKLTSNKAALQKVITQVVRHRIRSTGNRKPQLVTTDFDVIEDVLIKGWELKNSFDIRYKHLIEAGRKGQEVTERDIDHILSVRSSTEPSSGEEEEEEQDDNKEDSNEVARNKKKGKTTTMKPPPKPKPQPRTQNKRPKSKSPSPPPPYTNTNSAQRDSWGRPLEDYEEDWDSDEDAELAVAEAELKVARLRARKKAKMAAAAVRRAQENN